MSWQLGIDVGNTTTAAATVRDGGPAQPLELGDGPPALASVVYVGPGGERFVGVDARARGAESPERLASGFERSLVTGVPVTIAGQRHDPAELMATLVAAVYRVACSREGGTPDHVAVTHRANAPTAAVDRLRAAITHALPGGPSVSLLPDADAASAHAATVTRFEPGDAIAVYDFGGGGLGVCIVRYAPFGFELVGRPGGAPDIGGADIDAALCALVVAKMPGAAETFAVGDAQARRQEAALRDACTDAKVRLSQTDTTPVSADVGGATITIDVTRAELERAAEPVVARSVERLAACLANAHMEAWELQGVLALGGVSRMRSVHAALVRATETEPIPGIDAKLAVALGAAAIGPARHAAAEARRYADEQAQRYGSAPAAGGPPAPAGALEEPRAGGVATVAPPRPVPSPVPATPAAPAPTRVSPAVPVAAVAPAPPVARVVSPPAAAPTPVALPTPTPAPAPPPVAPVTPAPSAAPEHPPRAAEIEPEPAPEPVPGAAPAAIDGRPPLTIPKSSPAIRPIVFVAIAVVAALVLTFVVLHHGGSSPASSAATTPTTGAPTTPTTVTAAPPTLDAVTVAARAATSLLTVSDFPPGFTTPATPWSASASPPPCAASNGAGDIDLDHPALALTGRGFESTTANAGAVEEIRVYGSESAAHAAFSETVTGLGCAQGDVSGATVPIAAPDDVTDTVGGDEADSWTLGESSTFVAARTGTVLVTFAFSPLRAGEPAALDMLGIVAEGLQHAEE